MTSEQLAELLDDTADAINVNNWYHSEYFPGLTPTTAEEVLARKNCRACAMGRLALLFVERGYKIRDTKRSTIIGQIENEIDMSFLQAVGGDTEYSLVHDIVTENDNEEAHIVDIQGFLHARAKEVRDA